MNPSTDEQSSQADLRMLMIETHSPRESGEAQDFLALVRAMLEAGSAVRLHLMQNGVIGVRGQPAKALLSLREQFTASLRITIDDVSLDLRGIPHALARDIGQVTGVDDLVAWMADPSVKTIWHS